MWSSLPCFCTFCCSAIPTSCYILNVFLLLVYIIFSASGTCLSSGLPSHSSRSLSQAAADIWTIDSGISYTWQYWLKNHWPKHPFKHWVNPSLDGWQSQLSLYKDQGRGTHRSRHSKSMDNTSLNHSDIFILMIGAYLSLHQGSGSIDKTTHTLLLRSHAQARYMYTTN